jgi:hypothetical protein
MTQKIKFVWNGIRVDGKLVRCFFSTGPYCNASYPDETITVYARSILDNLPRLEGVTIKNDTDLHTDYFESDTARILPDSKYYNEAKAALDAQRVHEAKIKAKHEARWQAYHANGGAK